jgi:heparan-alpha-glucosaminide N-acetyltransferase
MGRDKTNWTFEDTLSQIGLGYVPLFLLGFTKQRWQFAALVTILVGYWAAFAFYSPPETFTYEQVGVPADWPYHYSGLASHWNKNSNLATAFDTWLHQWLPRAREINPGGYATLSFIPTLGTMILGLIAGGWLRLNESAWKKIGSFLAVGGLLIALGLGAHESGLCPCVKRIWTPSWTLYSGGWCFLFLAFFYLTIDVSGWTSWSFPLRVIGANSIAAYLLADVTRDFIVSSLDTHLGAAVFSKVNAAYLPFWMGVAVLLIEWLILYWLYRQKIHIRI